MALPRRRGRLRRLERPAQPRVDLGHFLVGPITGWSGRRRRSSASGRCPARRPGHYGRGAPGDPTGAVTNEDYAAICAVRRRGARHVRGSRAIVGPESQMAFDVYGTKGAAGWNLERLNELQLYRADGRARLGLHDRVRRRPLPLPRPFVPGSANAIGFEDLVVIEDYEFCRAVAEGRPFTPGFGDALEWVSVQAALLRSVAARPVGGRRLAAGGLRWQDRSRDGGGDRDRVGALAHRGHRRRADRAHARRAARAPGARARRWPRSTTPRAGRARRRSAAELGVRVADQRRRAARPPTTSTPSRSARARRPTRADRSRPPRAGKAIFCEKPVSLDLGEVDRALAAVEARRRPVPDRLQPPLRPRARGGARRGRRRQRRRAAHRAHHQPRSRAAAARVRRASRAGSSST